METGIESREQDDGGGGGGQHWAPPKHLLQAGEVNLRKHLLITQNHWCANRTAAVTPKCRRTHSPKPKCPQWLRKQASLPQSHPPQPSSTQLQPSAMSLMSYSSV